MPTVGFFMMYEKLIKTEQCPQGQGIFVARGDKELAVFHLQDPDRFVVINNACPHANGNLSAGDVRGDCVTCPVHNWKFDLNTGRCVGTDDTAVKRYACKVEGQDLLVDLGEILPLPPPPRYDF